MQAIFERIVKCIAEKSEFIAWRLPNEETIHFLASTPFKIKISKLKNHSGFILFPFEGDGYCFPFDETKLETNQNTNSTNNFIITEDKHKQLCASFINEIQKGNFSKLVLSRIKRIQKKSDFRIEIYLNNLFFKPSSSFNYVCYTHEFGLWSGASPELLVKQQGEITKTMALAGTKSIDLSQEKWAEKEINEQKFVTDYINDCFSKTGYTEISFSENETIPAGQVVHIRTSFQAKALHDKSVFKLIEELHPTPAVLGLPKAAAKQFILESEPHQRKLYSGFLGPIKSSREMNLFVNLRCMEITSNSFDLFVGGGITADSDPEKEYLETELKAKTILGLL